MKMIFRKILCFCFIAPAFFQFSCSNKTVDNSNKTVDKPNILIIMTDQQSSDAMSNRIGNRYLNTPNMDYLASRGVTFTNAYTPNPLCIPSRSSIFTGRYPHELGIQINENKTIDPQEFPSLGTVLKDAGYETGYVGKWHLPYKKEDTASHGFNFMAHIRNVGIDSLLAEPAIQFMNQPRENPFALVVSFCNPHNICEWARGDKLPDGEVGTPGSIEECPPLLPNHMPTEKESGIMKSVRESYQAAKMFPVGNFDDNKWREYRWAYYRMIEKVDTEIGKVLEGLKNSGKENKTAIIFLSDHGDAQGAHKWNQKTVFYEESSHVPLIVCYPGSSKSVNNKLVNTGVDLVPTLCDFAGIPVPEGLPGTSFMSSTNQDNNYVVVSNKMVQGVEIDGHKPEPEGRMVRSMRYKYWIVIDAGNQEESLFDMEKDPGEMLNLADDPSHEKVLQQHRQFLAEWCKKHGDAFPYIPAF